LVLAHDINLVLNGGTLGNKPALVYLTGASGVGKTTILSCLREHSQDPNTIFLHFDSIGVPSSAEMVRKEGSLENWQEITTHRWIEKIVTEYQDSDIVVIEGQSSLDFVEDACNRFGITDYIILLIDCDEDTMHQRLVHNRKQPELVSEDMRNWLVFLRAQATRKKVCIVDTSSQSLESTVCFIQEQVLDKIRMTR